ncbi:hypothetical protein EYF80_005727 [Liparis tanakae]|uniref:Uncharacterized protein n=1 Tax=Liparis tanakae TaxID=230148 RepID=A0A4Z2J116_9TELE|nr:hypothetical protein EYF80_005727 [Liparis tanakae]
MFEAAEENHQNLRFVLAGASHLAESYLAALGLTEGSGALHILRWAFKLKPRRGGGAPGATPSGTFHGGF